MVNIEFPLHNIKQIKSNINRHHYEYKLNFFKAMGTKFNTYTPSDDKYMIYINDLKLYIDSRDSCNLYTRGQSDILMKVQLHSQLHNILPFPQISFCDWGQYYELTNKIKYCCNSDIILNNQTIYGNAVNRRTTVKNMLISKYSNHVDFKRTSFLDFLKKINNCLVYVHVPGYSNNMLDRAHQQMFGLGCCVITTEIPNILPLNKKYLPGIHYIKCNDDYSDLYEKIEWCKQNRSKCIEIGNNAKTLFQETCTPKQVLKYITNIIK